MPVAGANPPVSAKTAAEADTGAKVLDGLQLGLDVVGLIPGVGEIADLANAGIKDSSYPEETWARMQHAHKAPTG